VATHPKKITLGKIFSFKTNGFRKRRPQSNARLIATSAISSLNFSVARHSLVFAYLPLILLASNAISVKGASAQVINTGTLTGTAGNPGTTGSDGSDGPRGNYGSAYMNNGTGGDGGTGGSGGTGGQGGLGGTGQTGSSITITNSGTIIGGTGGSGGTGGRGGNGGDGGSGAYLMNSCNGPSYNYPNYYPSYSDPGCGYGYGYGYSSQGAGGNGGNGGNGGDGGNGGPGVSGSGLIINNSGTITGGQGGSGGNSGSGGMGGNGGYGSPSGQFGNSAYYYGSMSYMYSYTLGGNGGAGVSLNGGTNTIINGSNASIQGGSHGYGTGYMYYYQSRGGDGINLSGGTTAITNLGTIVGRTSGSSTTYGIRLTGSASISTLVNVQGGNNPLTYYGTLPNTYNVVVQSSTSFGKFAVDWSSGSLAFGVDSTSILETNRYVNVLTGVGASGITNEETEFLLGSYAWNLIAGSTANSWDLLVTFRGMGSGTSTNITSSSTTTFAGGTLLVSSSGQYGQNWSLGSAATNTIDLGGNSSLFSGSFSNSTTGQPGNIIFSNVGSAVLSALSTYTGSTTVANGAKLSVNGSIASSSGLTVNSGATIGGTGTLPTTTIQSGGTLAPGNSISHAQHRCHL